MRSMLLRAAAGALALGVATTAHAGTGRELAALSATQQSNYLGSVIEAIAQFFQQTDGVTVRSNCVNRWYRQNVQAANAEMLANATSYPNEDPVRVVMAMLIKQCGRDKDEGMQILRDRVAKKLDVTEEATKRALAEAEREKAAAEANLKGVQARAWRLPDGRRIYQAQDGTWRFENGAVVPPSLAGTRVPPK